MKVLKQTISLILVACLLMGTIMTFIGCTKTEIIDNETYRLVLATTELDGVFNPFYSSSATDGSIVGMTQLGMLSSDKDGRVAYGEDEACVVLDYQAQYILADGTVVDEIDANDDVAYTRYRFVLKNDVKFSNGTPLTMKDVLFNLYVYLDPAYYGSSTIYSTEIVGLQEYRTQTSNKNEQEDFEAGFEALAGDRIDRLYETIVEIKDENKNKSFTEDEMLHALTAKMQEYSEVDASYATLIDDFNLMKTKFKDELQQHYNNSRGGAQDIVFSDQNGNKVTLTTDTESFLYTVGLISWDKKNYKYNYSLGEASKNWTEQQAIDNIFNSYYPNKAEEILVYWNTGMDLLTYFTYLEKQKHFENVTDKIENISGIRYANRTEAISVNGIEYAVPTLDANGAVTNDTNEILEITIEKVDPKAIWNFAFTVAPMFYYSDYEVYKDFDYETNFGVQFGSIEFMDKVIKNPDKIGVPVGAGPYKATTRTGDSSNVTAGTFKADNVVYFERNEHFLFDVKIKYVNYQVVPTNLMLESLYSGGVHFVEPACKQENINSLDANRDKGFAGVPITTNGYGYIGINAEKVPNLAVRQAIMHAVNTQYAIDYYGTNYAEPIYRPMTKESWAYPSDTDKDGQYYEFDSTGVVSEQLVIEAGYKKNSDGIYYKGNDVLEYTFTIAGDTTDHPAYMSLKKAAEILNEHGFKITVKTDINALKKLNDGALEVWAAAWGAGVDPDMYQVYHIDSTAGATSNWGYRAIKANAGGKYDVELGIVQDLSDIIDRARGTLDEKQRTELYAQALDLVMELAVELPTYQRSDLFAYNTNVIDIDSLTPSTELTSYNGPLNRIWEVSLNETEGAGIAGDSEKGNGGLVAVIIIAALLVAGGAGVGVYFVLKNKKAEGAESADASSEKKSEDSDKVDNNDEKANSEE